MQQTRAGYWGFTPVRSQTAYPGANQAQSRALADEAQQPVEAAAATRSWVQTMFSRDKAALAAGRTRRGTTDSNVLGMVLAPCATHFLHPAG